MPSNSLHSPLSSGEDLFPDGNADLDDVYNEQNHHKRSKHKKQGKHKSKKHKKNRSSSSHNLNLDDDSGSCAPNSSRSHHKHKSSKHRPQYDSRSEEEPFDSRQQPPAQSAYGNAKAPLVAGYEELSDTELLFKEDRAVSSIGSRIPANPLFCGSVVRITE